MLKKKKTIKLILLSLLASTSLNAQTGSWNTYMAYHDPQQIVKLGSYLFVRASNGLYTYNLNDQSITTYDKLKQLNDTYITMISRNDEAKKVLVVYQNQNMDVIDQQGQVDNISALYLKSMAADKTINSVCQHQHFAYLACGFGIVKLNMRKVEVTESYILNQNIRAVALTADSIYAQTDDGVIAAALKANLMNPAKWNVSTTVGDSFFQHDDDDWNQYIDLVKTLKPGGPKYNNFQFMRFKHNRLYTVGGGRLITTDLRRPGCIQVLDENHEWQIMQDNIEEVTGWRYLDIESVDADPTDPNHLFAGGRTGLYEFKDNLLVKAYNYDNSPLVGNEGIENKGYTLVYSVLYDDNNNLWCLNSRAPQTSLLELTPSGEWQSHHQSDLNYGDYSYHNMRGLVKDSRGYLWFFNEHWEEPCFLCYDPATKSVIHKFTTLTNQDGTTYSDYAPTCIAEDLDGNIWLGSTIGPFLIEASTIGTANAVTTQVKVPRNDGSNLADYLMASAHINTMVVDGAGRKWFGTLDNGIYLISADNMEELEHFTTENSPLLSNGVNALAINNTTGELFIGTDMGLCSYITDATTAVETMQKDDFTAFPNPVTPDYDGLITVRGFSLDADVKILSTSGKLIAEGRSNGGTFTWDGRDRSGRRVASGVYMVATATSDGKKGTVCKIAVVN